MMMMMMNIIKKAKLTHTDTDTGLIVGIKKKK